MAHGRFFTASNAQLSVTNVSGAYTSLETVHEWFFGTVGSSATGEAGLKVVLAGSTTSAGGAINVTSTATPYIVGAPTTASVSGTSGLALAANANRKTALIYNNGATDAFLAVGAAAVAGAGILVKATGGVYEINSTNLTLGAVNCITASSTTSLSVFEGV